MDQNELLATKKRKFESGCYDAEFFCPLCKDSVAYFFAYTHLKECIFAYEELYLKKIHSFSNQTCVQLHSISSLSPNSPSNFSSNLSTLPQNSSQNLPSNLPSILPRPPITRFPKCSFSNCNLTR